jgi:hypothetical protein
MTRQSFRVDLETGGIFGPSGLDRPLRGGELIVPKDIRLRDGRLWWKYLSVESMTLIHIQL